MASPAVGIDLGTTNSVVAVSLNGKPQVLVDPAYNSPLIPSVVSFPESGERLVGRPARARKAFDPAHTVSSVKRLLGRPFKSEEVRRAKSRVAFDLREGADSAVLVATRGGSFSLPEVSAMVLREVRRVAEQNLQQRVERCVVTVPANFNELQRSSTKIAGKVAELEVIRILNEPTAAALAYGYGRGSREKICIFDFGGGTFDVTLLELNGNVFEVLATAGDTFLGGDDIDMAIADALVPHLLRATKVDAGSDRLAYDILRDSVEGAKCVLAQRDTAQVDFNYQPRGAGAPVRFQHTLTRPDLDRLAGPLIKRTFDVCGEALKLAGLRATDLTSVILVGGSTRIHSVRSQVAQFFGREPLTHLPPEEVVALGASILAEALTGGTRRAGVPTTRQMVPPTLGAKPPEAPVAAFGPRSAATTRPQAPGVSDQGASMTSTSGSALRAQTLTGVAPEHSGSQRPPAASPFRAPTPPPLPPGVARGSVAPPPLIPGRPLAPPPVPPPTSAKPAASKLTGFDLDDPFSDSAPGGRTVASPSASGRPTPMPPVPGFDDLDEPSFVGKLPQAATGRASRVAEQRVPAFNLDDPSVAMPMPVPSGAMMKSSPPDEVDVDTGEQPALPAVPAHLPAMTAHLPAMTAGLPAMTAGLPAMVAGLPATAAGLPAATAGLPTVSAGLPSTVGAGLPTTAAGLPDVAPELPQFVSPPMAKPPIGAPPRASSPEVQSVKPPIGAPPRASSPEVRVIPPSSTKATQPDSPASAFAGLPPSIAAAIKAPPPKRDAPMFPAQDEPTTSMPAVEERSIPSFKLDTTMFGDESSAPSGAQGGGVRDFSVPSFRIDADDIFGGSGEAGSSTLMAKSPFEATVTDNERAQRDEETRRVPAIQQAPAPPMIPPVQEEATQRGYAAESPGEATRQIPSPFAMEGPPGTDPIVVPPPMRSALGTFPGGASPLTQPRPVAPPASTDSVRPGLPPAPQRPGAPMVPPTPAQITPSTPPMAYPSGPPAATLSGAPPRPSMMGGIAAPLLLDVTPFSLGVETAGGLCETVIRRNSTIPVEQTRVFATTNDDQTSVVIRIAQGESRKFSENQPLGELELSGLRAAQRGDVSVAVTFELEADGTLRVRAKDVETGREAVSRVTLLTIPSESAQADMAARSRSMQPAAV